MSDNNSKFAYFREEGEWKRKRQTTMEPIWSKTLAEEAIFSKSGKRMNK